MVFAVSKDRIITVLMSYRAMIDSLAAAIAYIWSLIQSVALFLNEVRTGSVTGRTGSTFNAAKDDLAAGICLFTIVPVGAEIAGVIKSSFVIPISKPVESDFF